MFDNLACSGVLPIALGPEGSIAANWLQAQFAGRLVHKAGIVSPRFALNMLAITHPVHSNAVLQEYLCLVEGRSVGAVGSTAEINSPLHTIRKGGLAVFWSRHCKLQVSSGSDMGCSTPDKPPDQKVHNAQILAELQVFFVSKLID